MQLRIEIPENNDVWDGEQFVHIKKQTLILMHSLVSISKWESIHKKSFFLDEGRTPKELEDYIRCMTINSVDENVYYVLTPEDITRIAKYIDDPMTATTVYSLSNEPSNRGTITSELIYYKMIRLGIPIEFEKWHFNRLLTLIRVCDIKDGNTPKMSANDTLAWQAAMNEKRLAAGKFR